jgi:hypothetical protein
MFPSILRLKDSFISSENALPFLLAVVLAIPFSVVAAPALPAKLTEDQVIKLANAAAKRSGYKLEDHEAPKARYEAEGRGGSWYVFYQAKARRPGGHFYVTVDDRTKSTEVWPGE